MGVRRDIKRRALFFIEGPKVPASRYRVLQFLSKFPELRAVSTVLSTVPNKYLAYPPTWSRTAAVRLPVLGVQLGLVIAQRLRHIVCYARSADVIFLQRDLLYRVPQPFLEKLLYSLIKSECRVVFDVDDAIYLDNTGTSSESGEGKLRTICSRCDSVIVGNDYLTEKFGAWSDQVQVIPTVIDTEEYVPPSAVPGSVLGWTGLKSNLPYLEQLRDPLRTSMQGRSTTLRIVCESGTPNPFNDIGSVEMIGWSEQAEAQQLHGIRIGLVPLRDDPWTKGKCGLKLLQFMALGIPCVASPVGVISSMIEHGTNGFLASTPNEWSEYCDRLLSDESLWKQMSERARATVVQNYSVSAWKDRWERAVWG